MNTRKFLLFGLMTFLFTISIMAQDDNQAVIKEISEVIKSRPADLDAQMKVFLKKNKKNADVLTGVGRAYLESKDTINARVYAGHALKANSNYAGAYVLLGDIEASAGEGGKAANYYEQAIFFDPQDPNAYYKYASVYRKVSPEGAINKLEELRSQRPDIAVDALEARVYYSSNEFDNAIESFSKAGINNLDEADLTSYAMSLFLTQNYEKSFEVAKVGLTKSPKSAAFNRLAFFDNTDMEHYDVALEYADALFNKSDSAKLSYFDYTYYGNALSGAKRYDEAIEMYQKALEQEFEDKTKRSGVIKQLSEGYRQKDDYENAIKTYKEFLESVDNPQANDIAGLASLYTQYAGTLEGEARIENLKKAESTYVELKEKFADADEFAIYKIAQVNAYMDPETSEGLAKPYYEELASLVEKRTEKDASDIARLKECYRYLGYYYLLQDDMDTSISFWNKILELAPDDPQANEVINSLSDKKPADAQQ